MLLGRPVAQEDSGELLGYVNGILLHPDTGTVEGFFVGVPRGFFGWHSLFLSSLDVRRLSTALFVRGSWVLSETEEIFRVQSLLADARTILGQKIRTVSGASLGTCADVQFDTLHFRLEWIYPKRWFRLRDPLPAAEIVEVKSDAIVVKDPIVPALLLEQEESTEEKARLMPSMPGAA